MAKSAQLGQSLYYHGRDLGGDVGTINNASTPVNVIDVTSISQSATDRILTTLDSMLNFNAFFNDATGQAHSAFSGLPTTDVIVSWSLGQAQGDAVFSMTGKQATYNYSRPDDGSLIATIDVQGAAGHHGEWMELFTTGQDTSASAGNSSSRDDGAATSAGIAAVLHVVDIDSGTPTVKIQQSSDDGSGDAFADLVTFSAVANGNEPTAERKTVSGAVERYLRVAVTGTYSNLDYVLAYRRGSGVGGDSY
jgi:hypothetical protein